MHRQNVPFYMKIKRGYIARMYARFGSARFLGFPNSVRIAGFFVGLIDRRNRLVFHGFLQNGFADVVEKGCHVVQFKPKTPKNFKTKLEDSFRLNESSGKPNLRSVDVQSHICLSIFVLSNERYTRNRHTTMLWIGRNTHTHTP